MLQLDQLRDNGGGLASFWRQTSPTLSEVLGQLDFVCECHQIRDLSINSFQAGLADSVLLSVSSFCLTNLELGSVHEVTYSVLHTFFRERGSRLKCLSLAYDPAEMPIDNLTGLLLHTRQLRTLAIGLDSCTARTLRTRIAQVRRGWPPIPSLYQPEVWHFEEILRVVGSGLIALTVPFHGQWTDDSDNLPKHGKEFIKSFAECRDLEVLAFSSFFDDHSDSACRGALEDCSLMQLISGLPRLKLLDASKISITRREFLAMLDLPVLEYVQLEYGAQERDVVMSRVYLEGTCLRYDSGTKSMVPLTSDISPEGQRFATKLQMLRDFHTRE